MTADTLNILKRILRCHGEACARSRAALKDYRLKSSWDHFRRAERLSAMHHRILVAMLPHSELTQLLLRRVS